MEKSFKEFVEDKNGNIQTTLDRQNYCSSTNISNILGYDDALGDSDEISFIGYGQRCVSTSFFASFLHQMHTLRKILENCMFL